MPIKQSFCYPCFTTPGQSLDELFETAASIGYVAVETWFRDDKFEPMLASARKAGLAVASMCGHKSLKVGMNQRSEHDRIVKEVEESILLAADLGIPNLICFSGNRNEGQSDEEGLEECARCFSRVAPLAEKHNINLNTELLNSLVNHEGYLCDHTAAGVTICEKVGSPRVKLLYDIYHMQIMEGQIIANIQKHIAHIGHFHTAGNPGRRDMDDTQELNYRGICNAIAATGYDGYVAHEFRPKGDAIEGLRTAYDICNAQSAVKV